MTNKEFLSQINIVKIISEYLPLSKVGRNYKALCPFHKENTPSFIVSDDKQIYKCFACGQTGNAIKFVSDYEKISYKDAIKKIALANNINIDSLKEPEIDPKLQKYYQINDVALEYFKYNGENDQTALDYFKIRNISLDVINAYKLGFVANGDNLIKILKLKDFKDIDIINNSLGLISDNKVVPFFKNRIMIPIFNEENKCLGFSGRSIFNNDIKYLNSKETAYFKKNKIFFNSQIAFYNIKQDKFCILVEGYMDVFAFYKADIKNVLATMGTNLSNYHLEKILNLTNNVIFGFDNDKAGLESILKNGKFLKKMSINTNIFVLDFHDTKDADEYLNKYGSAALIKLVDNKKDFLTFYTNYLLNNWKYDDIYNKNIFLEEIEKYLINETENILEILAKILSEKLDLDYEYIYSRFIKAINKQKQVLLASSFNQVTEDFLLPKRNNSVSINKIFAILINHLIHPNIFLKINNFTEIIMAFIPPSKKEWKTFLNDLKEHSLYQEFFKISNFSYYYPNDNVFLKSVIEVIDPDEDKIFKNTFLSDAAVNEIIFKFAKSIWNIYKQQYALEIYKNSYSNKINQKLIYLFLENEPTSAKLNEIARIYKELIVITTK